MDLTSQKDKWTMRRIESKKNHNNNNSINFLDQLPDTRTMPDRWLFQVNDTTITDIQKSFIIIQLNIYVWLVIPL